MKNIMVCVTKQKTCQRLIDYGRSLISSGEDQLFVIHVAKEQDNILGSREEGEALEFLYEKAKEAGAALTVEKSEDVMKALVQIVERNDITHVIAGESGEAEAAGGFLRHFEEKLCGKAHLVVVPAVS